MPSSIFRFADIKVSRSNSYRLLPLSNTSHYLILQNSYWRCQSYQDEGYEYVEILKGREALEALKTKQDGESLIEPHESVVIQKIWYKRT
ncbi:hypothetical protein CFRS1_v015161 [Colletotrichum fructicola]|nr:hypothetical protein CFRS1_v015161 [Colletotrichum fructicola]